MGKEAKKRKVENNAVASVSMEGEEESEKEGGRKLLVPKDELPKPQRLIDVSLDTSSHLLSSALSSDNRLFALSNQEGTRLFALTVEELEVRKITGRKARAAADGESENKGSGDSVLENHPASVLHFLAPTMLAIGSLRTNELIILDVKKMSNIKVLARFAHHKAPISLITTSGEYICTSDINGAVHLFKHIDIHSHYCKIPSFAVGTPTAIAFTKEPSKRLGLIAVSSSHEFFIFDVDKRELREDIVTTIPEEHLKRHHRVCGIITNPEAPEKVLLWSPMKMIKVNLSIQKEEGEQSGATANEASEIENGEGEKKKKKRRRNLPLFSIANKCQWEEERRFRWIQALMETPWKKQSMLMLETTPTEFQASLPTQFQRKTWGH